MAPFLRVVWCTSQSLWTVAAAEQGLKVPWISLKSFWITTPPAVSVWAFITQGSHPLLTNEGLGKSECMKNSSTSSTRLSTLSKKLSLRWEAFKTQGRYALSITYCTAHCLSPKKHKNIETILFSFSSYMWTTAEGQRIWRTCAGPSSPPEVVAFVAHPRFQMLGDSAFPLHMMACIIS